MKVFFLSISYTMKHNSIAKAFNCIGYNMPPRDDLKCMQQTMQVI